MHQSEVFARPVTPVTFLVYGPLPNTAPTIISIEDIDWTCTASSIDFSFSDHLKIENTQSEITASSDTVNGYRPMGRFGRFYRFITLCPSA